MGLSNRSHVPINLPTTVSGPEMSFSFLPSSPCQPDEVHFELLLLTDGKGHETSWVLAETYSLSIVLSGDGYGNNEQHNIIQCIPAKCYSFVIKDSSHDGMTDCYGGYSVRLNGLRVASGNAFGSSDGKDLRCMIPPTDAPTLAPVVASECSNNANLILFFTNDDANLQ